MSTGERITIQGGQLRVPDRPVIPFIEGDGTGADIWAASQAAPHIAAHCGGPVTPTTAAGHERRTPGEAVR